MHNNYNLNKFAQYKKLSLTIIAVFPDLFKLYAHKTSALSTLEPWNYTPDDIFPIILSHVAGTDSWAVKNAELVLYAMCCNISINQDSLRAALSCPPSYRGPIN